MEQISPISAYRRDHDCMSLEAFGALFVPALNKSTIMRWERKGVPVDRVLEVEKVTGIARHQLCPQFFQVPAIQEAAE